MANNYSFETEDLRGKYAREVRGLFERNNLNWGVFPSAKTKDIFIRPKYPPAENERDISRISLQIRDDAISLGISGYFPRRVKETIKILTDKTKGYKYHRKGYDEKGNRIPEERPGRWWLTKSLDNLDSIIGEFKDIEPLLYEKF